MSEERNKIRKSQYISIIISMIIGFVISEAGFKLIGFYVGGTGCLLSYIILDESEGNKEFFHEKMPKIIWYSAIVIGFAFCSANYLRFGLSILTTTIVAGYLFTYRNKNNN